MSIHDQHADPSTFVVCCFLLQHYRANSCCLTWRMPSANLMWSWHSLGPTSKRCVCAEVELPRQLEGSNLCLCRRELQISML
jgi:hypothetical protein